MKNMIKSALLLMFGACILTSCDDDNDSNPTLQSPTSFVLNTPAIATGNTIDLANSESITLTCSQPNYGFPISTTYKVQVATKSDMSDATELSSTYTSAKIDVDAAELASTLTDMYLNAGKTEADFPMDVPVYFRLRANMVTSDGTDVDGMEILSNTVALNKVHLLYSLPPVTVPSALYLVGSFCGWDWGSSLSMVPVYGTDNVFWHLVYIDGSGIKFNTATSWDGNEKGIAGLNSITGDLASEIQDSGDGNIASSNPGWYLMIVTASVAGRDVLYDVQFNKPEVWLIGTVTALADWSELEDGMQFSVPSTADGEFVSPAFVNNAASDSGVRAYVKVPGYDWWKSEFMVFDGALVYRGTGGDQDRVEGYAGQRLYINFTSGTGSIK